MILAKLSVIPVRRGYWGAGIGDPHTVPVKVTGKCGSVTARLVPAPKRNGDCCCSCTEEGSSTCWDYGLLYYESWKY